MSYDRIEGKYTLSRRALEEALRCHVDVGSDEAEREANRKIILTSYTFWLNLLIDYSLKAQLSESEVEGQMSRFLRIVESTTFTQLSSTTADLYDAARQLPTAADFRVSWFKAKYHESVARMFIRVLEPFIEKVRLTCDPSWIRCILSLCVFPFRSTVIDTDLSESMLQDYLSIERSIADRDLQGYSSSLLHDLNKIIRKWLRDWKDPIVPAITSGSVSDPKLRLKHEKYSALCYDACVEYMIKREYGFSSQRFSPFYLGDAGEFDGYERVIFVPKNATKLRTVCCNPVTKQYYQAGVQRSLYAFMHRTAFFRAHVPLFNQEVCRRLALKGSQYSTLGTLDLSAASDRISWQVVKELFRGTRLVKWLIATRTPHSLLPNGLIVRSRKAFAMGACLCFPVMSLLIAAVVEFVARRCKETHRSWTVYGDDIICPTNWCSSVIMILEHLGLAVNTAKSFYGQDDAYRESCGMEAWNGVDVTPIRFPRKYSPATPIAELVESLSSIANRCYTYSLKRTRICALRYLGEVADVGPYGRHPLLFSIPPEYGGTGVGLWSRKPTNFRCKHRTTVTFGDRQVILPTEEVKCMSVNYRARNVQWTNRTERIRLFDTELEQFRHTVSSAPPENGAMPLDKYTFASGVQPVLRWCWRRIE